jgi:isopentenyl-diphosphate delta-isomerase
MHQRLILVDPNDNEIGSGEKMPVHRRGLLHRAFSIFVLNPRQEVLLQRRALSKYHSGGLWANTCCSHPILGEEQHITVQRRLREEMGFETSLERLFSFRYRAELDNGLIEHELDHVYLGRYDGKPDPNPKEVCDWQWMSLEQLGVELKEQPDKYVYWLKPAFDEFYVYHNSLTVALND